MGKDRVIDFENRDPNDINDHLKVEFEDCIAEPPGAHSCDCVWKNSICCFDCGMNCCYRLMTTLCGCCIALCWGCEFACITFNHVWQFTPCLRVMSINCGFLQKVWGTCVTCCCAPICETFGLCFSRINVNESKG